MIPVVPVVGLFAAFLVDRTSGERFGAVKPTRPTRRETSGVRSEWPFSKPSWMTTADYERFAAKYRHGADSHSAPDLSSARPMNQEEIEAAKKIYGNAIDYSRIVLMRSMTLEMPGAAAYVTFPQGMFERSLSPDTDRDFVVTATKYTFGPSGDQWVFTEDGYNIMIHELRHVQEGQRSRSGRKDWAEKSSRTFSRQIMYTSDVARAGSKSDMYDWRKYRDMGRDWDQWPEEARAEALEDYQKAKRAFAEAKAALEWNPRSWADEAKKASALKIIREVDTELRASWSRASHPSKKRMRIKGPTPGEVTPKESYAPQPRTRQGPRY